MTDSTLIPPGSRYLEMLREFQGRYGCRPALWVRAPGRVELMGSHTDYNQGLVLTLSIDRDTWLAVSPRADGRVVVGSMNLPGTDEFELAGIEHGSQVLWGNYVRAVAWAFQEAGYRLAGFDGLIHSTVPTGSGLSSSAALEVAAAQAFGTLGGWDGGLPPERKALLCQRAENVFVGANTGILDQYTAVFGRAGCALLLDCRYLSNEAVPIHRDISIIICDTRAKRELTGTAYGERRAACEEGARAFGRVEPGVLSLRDVTPEAWGRHAGLLAGPVADRCRFIIEENRRVPAMAAALRDGDWDAIGALTAASYEGARDLFEIVGEEMAAMMAAMRAAPGIIGARQSGGGFGGCMVAFAKAGCEEDFAAQVVSAYRAASGLDAQVFAVRAGPGAGAVETG